MAKMAGWFRDLITTRENTIEYRVELIAFNIANQVYNRIKELNITQNKLAEKLNVSKSYISQILKGKTNMTLETLIKLGNALNLTPIVELSPVGNAPAVQSHAEFKGANLFTNSDVMAASSASATNIIRIAQLNPPKVEEEYGDLCNSARVAQIS